MTNTTFCSLEYINTETLFLFPLLHGGILKQFFCYGRNAYRNPNIFNVKHSQHCFVFCSVHVLCDGSLSTFSSPKDSSLDSVGVVLLAVLPGNIKWLRLQLIPWGLGNSPLEALIIFLPDVSEARGTSVRNRRSFWYVLLK